MSTIAAGTTSTTALVNTGDTTGNLVFQTNGTTTAMTIDTSQNVGVGTSSPSYKLDVVGTARIQTSSGYNVFFQTSGTTARINYLNDAFSTNISAAYRATDFAWQKGDGSEVLKLDSSGNLGLGVTPSASWQSARRVLQVGGNGALWGQSSGAGTLFLSNNTYYDGTNFRYLNTSGAGYYAQLTDGSHSWNQAASGTAGNVISFTQAMTLDSSGNLLVGTTSHTGGTGTIRANTKSGNWGIVVQDAVLNNALVLFLTSTAATVGSITQNGSSTSYNTTSDYRLKDNPQPLTGSGAFIDALKPKTWQWKVDGSRGVGFIAHEVQEVSPSSVVGEKDGEQVQAMEYGSAEFIANIIAELQTLRARVAALEGAK